MIQNVKNRTFYHTRQKQKNSQLDILQRIIYNKSGNGSIKRYYNTVLLLYVFHAIRGRDLHFRTCNRKSGTAYLFYPQTPYKIGISETFHPNKTQNTTSVMSSTKPWKIKHFITFNTIKNHQYSTLKSPQTLEK